MRAHTTSPWSHETRPDSGGDDRPVVVGGGGLVCAVSRRDGNDKEMNANARLLATAPKLLDTLCEVAELIADYVDVVDGDDGPRPNNAMRAVTAIQDAVRRAGGSL